MDTKHILERVTDVNEIFPIGELPHERIEWLEQYYIRAEKIRLDAWNMLQDIHRDIVRFECEEELSTEKMINSHADYDGETLKIVVNDYLPRKCLISDRKVLSMLRQAWWGNVLRPLNQLKKKTKIEFNQMHCIIITYVPRDVVWDIDNRVYKFIPDALKYTGIIPNDSWRKMSFSVIGRVDKENPRTEIYVKELSKIFPELSAV